MTLKEDYEQLARRIPYGVDRKLREPHRYYHNTDHIVNIAYQIHQDYNTKSITDEQCDILLCANYYHDVIYNPRRKDNEYESIRYFKNTPESYQCSDVVSAIIRYTDPDTYGTDLSTLDEELQFLIKKFRSYDLDAFHKKSIIHLTWNYTKLLKEFQFIRYPEFRANTIAFVQGLMKLGWFDNILMMQYIRYVSDYKPTIGIYAGSFNPFHMGHLSVLEQAEKLFDKVIIAKPANQIANTFPKTHQILPFHEVVEFDGLLLDYIKQVQEYATVTLIRGLRNGNDLEYELNMKAVNQDIAPNNHDTIYFISDKPHVSSTVVRSMEHFDNESWSMYIPTKYDYIYKDPLKCDRS
jgi:pantetheine-phosphate adenylyltransferase